MFKQEWDGFSQTMSMDVIAKRLSKPHLQTNTLNVRPFDDLTVTLIRLCDYIIKDIKISDKCTSVV